MPKDLGVDEALAQAPLLDLLPAEGDTTVGEAVSLCLIDEGAANFIYDIRPLYSAQSLDPQMTSENDASTWSSPRRNPTVFRIASGGFDDMTRGKLLRIGKDSPLCPTGEESYRFFREVIMQHFEFSELLNTRPVRLASSTVTALNDHITYLDEHKIRPERRRYTSIAADQSIGLLIDDMRSLDPAKSFTLEFKPKWLAQSPNAPEDATRCRNCALKAYRATTSAHSFKTASFCPIGLISGDVEWTRQAMDVLITDDLMIKLDDDTRQKAVRSLTNFFTSGRGYRLLLRLRELQQQHASKASDLTSSKDPLDQTQARQKLSHAMTLRDCSLFVRYTLNAPDAIEARMADLDPKPLTKYDDWMDQENTLISEGYYAGIRTSNAGDTCMLGT